MFTLQKNENKDFLVLNLSDPQLGDGEWDEGHRNYKILTGTVKSLIERVHPDLITISGDLPGQATKSLTKSWLPSWTASGFRGRLSGGTMTTRTARISSTKWPTII